MTIFTGSEFYATDEHVKLTPRQLEVLTWVAEGKENPAIATILGRSIATVKDHLAHLFDVFNATNRQQLVARAFAAGALRARITTLCLLTICVASLHDSHALRPRPPRQTNARLLSGPRQDETPADAVPAWGGGAGEVALSVELQ